MKEGIYLVDIFFEKLSIVECLQFILDHPTLVFAGRNDRSRPDRRFPSVTEALWMAADILPEGRSKRALTYVAKHDNVIFNFGGTDAVGPAIKEAIVLLTRKVA